MPKPLNAKKPPAATPESAGIGAGKVLRIRSKDLLQQTREIEIEHMGRIYRLRITQHNKLILTA